MYESFFNLSEPPFNAVPLVHRYYPAAVIEDARERIAQSIERAQGPALLIGPAGTGKSLLLHVLAEQFTPALAIAHLAGGHLCSRRTLLQAILYELGLEYRDLPEGELRLSLIDHLAPDGPCPDGMLLLVDEAQSLPMPLLEELRMITDLVRGGRPRARLVLAGSASLEETFAHPKLNALSQRLSVRRYLEAFGRDDTVQFVRAQIAASGGDPDQIFTAEALDAVHRATEGIPRLINQLCDHALGMASANGTVQLSPAAVEEAWADLQQLPTPWSASDAPAVGFEETEVVEFGTLDDEDVSGDRSDHEVTSFAALPADCDTTAPPMAFPDAAPIDDAPLPPAESLDDVGESLTEADEPFEPAGSIGPQTDVTPHFANDPFAESFDEEEEVVISRCVSLESGFAAARQSVRSFESQEISAALHQTVDVKSETLPSLATIRRDDSPVAVFTAELDPVMPEDDGVPLSDERSAGAGDFDVVADVVAIDDQELVIVEDEVDDLPTEPASLRSRNYHQLFSRLRGE